jgi:EH domain-containing protein 1
VHKGKSTFIKTLLGEEYQGMKIGIEPTTDKFTVVMYGDSAKTVPGNALAVDKSLNFRALSKVTHST